jgi:uncharacterized protein with HEPN domain
MSESGVDRTADRLRHIQAATDAIRAYVDRGRGAFDEDSAVSEAILYQIIVVGEAVQSLLSSEPNLPTRHPEIPWRSIARMRDRVAHHYWATDFDLVWTTATEMIPSLRRAVDELLDRRR